MPLANIKMIEQEKIQLLTIVPFITHHTKENKYIFDNISFFHSKVSYL